MWILDADSASGSESPDVLRHPRAVILVQNFEHSQEGLHINVLYQVKSYTTRLLFNSVNISHKMAAAVVLNSSFGRGSSFCLQAGCLPDWWRHIYSLKEYTFIDNNVDDAFTSEPKLATELSRLLRDNEWVPYHYALRVKVKQAAAAPQDD